MDDQETDFLEDTETETKPKKQLSEQKLQHLANIRVKALEKKKEMKQMTEKVNELKKIEKSLVTFFSVIFDKHCISVKNVYLFIR